MLYTPRWGRFERQKLQQAVADPSGAAARDLVDRFVLVGLPQRYRREVGPA